MDFDLSDEQRMLKDSVERLLADKYEFEARQKLISSEQGYSDEIWGQLAELGLLALPFARIFKLFNILKIFINCRSKI